MSSAILELQTAIADGQQPITQLLRRTKIIAASLDLEDIEKWVDLELQGYPQDAPLPKYRTYMAQNLESRHPMYGWQFVGHLNQPVKARFPISEIENYANGEVLVFPVTHNFTLTDQIGETGMVSSWPQRYLVAGSQFKKIVEAVRDELLQWTTELRKRGIKGENMDFNEQEKQTASSIIYNIGTVHGAVGNVTNSQITFYDNKTINQLLVEKNLPKDDRREIEDILDELKHAPHEKKKTLIGRAEQLIVKHKEVLGATAEIIIKSIKAMV